MQRQGFGVHLGLHGSTSAKDLSEAVPVEDEAGMEQKKVGESSDVGQV